MSVKPTGPAITTTGGAIDPIVVGGGYQSDGDDATYVDAVERKVADGAAAATTFRYRWDFDPDPNLPSSAVVRARVTMVDDTLLASISDPAYLTIGLARASDGLVLGNLGRWLTYQSAAVGVPTWVTFSQELDAAAIDALRTGTYTGYGAVQLWATWDANMFGSTAPVGSEARLRLHEFYIGPIASPPLRRYPGGTATPRLYPRPVTRRPGTY